MKPNLQKSDRNNRSFTMIELLVVITILGILASLLLPTLSRAKEKSRIALCYNNMKQIGIAIRMYANDNNDVTPLYKAADGQMYFGYTLDANSESWDWMIMPYLGVTTWGQSRMLICPTDSMRDGSRSSAYLYTSGTATNGRMARSYALNGTLPTSAAVTAGYGTLTNGQVLASVQAPGNTIIICERGQGDTGKYDNYQGIVAASSLFTGVAMGTDPPDWHIGKSNYLFVDGHVETLGRNQTIGKGKTTSVNLLGMWSLDPQD